MVKIDSAITLELESGQIISISLKEGKELITGLSRFVETNGTNGASQRGGKGAKAGSRQRRRVPGMSGAKRGEILKHVENGLSSKPRTLSNLLNGISYMPNHLPMIRRLVESQPHISKKTIGKRTFYFQAESNGRGEKSKILAAAA